MTVYQQPMPITRRTLEHYLTRLLYLDAEKLAYIVILILAILTRFWDLGARVMSHDESLHTKFSWYLYRGDGFSHTPLMHGPLLFHAVALNYLLFGDNDFTARIYPALVGIALVMTPYFMQRWLGRLGSLAASVMFLISPFILYYSRYIREDMPAVMSATLMAIAIWRYIEERKYKYLLLLAAGQAWLFATKEVSFIYVAIFGSFLTIYFIKRLLNLQWQHRSLFLAFGLALIGVLLALLLLGSVAYARSQLGPDTVASTPPPALEPAGQGLTTAPELPGWVLFLASKPALYIAIGLLGASLLTLIVSVIVGQWPNLRRFPELDAMIVMGTLILPMLTPFLILFAGFDPVDTSPEGVARSFEFTLPVLAASVIIGVLWGIKPPRPTLIADDSITDLPNDPTSSAASPPDPASAPTEAIPTLIEVRPDLFDWLQALWSSRWWPIGALFWLFFLFFFTTMFTNGAGIGTGIIGSLGYWLAQQEVQRGGQPWYYYIVVQIPLYEFLPALLALTAGGIGLIRELRSVFTPLPKQDNDDTPLNAAQRRQPLDLDAPIKFPVLGFTGYWAVMNVIAYSIAGEKMPWLTTHLTTPMILLGGWVVGRLLERIAWHKLFQTKAWLLLILIPVLAITFVRTTAPLCAIRPAWLQPTPTLTQETGAMTAPPPTSQPMTVGEALIRIMRIPCNTFIPIQYQQGLRQDDTLTSLAATGLWILAALVLVLTLFGIYIYSRGFGFKQVLLLTAFLAISGLGFLTARTAWLAAYVNYDDATEFMVYAHSSGAVKEVLAQIEEISLKTTDGYGLRVAYDNRVSWPYSWYLRNFYNAIYYDVQPSRGLIGDAPVILAGPGNWEKVEPLLGDRYYRFEYIRMWWPIQDYFGLTWPVIRDVLRNEAQQRGIWDIFYRRDYTAYGQAVGRSYEKNQWPFAERMRLYIRKDVFAQVWDYGVAASEIAQATDPYAQGARELLPDMVFGTGELNRPHGIALGPDGLLYVADTNNHRIAVFDPTTGNLVRTFGAQGYAPQLGVFNEPWDVAVAPDGTVFVADTWNHRVVKLSAQGVPLTAWGYEGPNVLSDPFAFWGPRGIAVDDQGLVYVADTGNKRIQVFDDDGHFIRQIGTGGGLEGQLDEPAGLAIDQSGLLFVADTWNQRVDVFTLEGLFVRLWYVDAWFAQTNERPYIDVDTEGRVYLTDPEAFRVLVFDRNGQYLYSFGDFATVGLAAAPLADDQGHLFVVNTQVGSVQRFDISFVNSPAQ